MKIIAILLSFCFIFCSLLFTVAQQNPVLTCPNGFPNCDTPIPTVRTSYVLSFSTGSNITGCRYDWTATGGVFVDENGNSISSNGQYQNGPQQVYVVWNNVPQGTIRVVVTGCSQSGFNNAFEGTINIRNLVAPVFTSPAGNPAFVPCSATSQVLTVQAQANADSYYWALPAGWTGPGGQNTFISTGNSVTVIPNTSTAGGTITARARLGTFLGPATNLPVQRGGSVSVSGPATARCGDVAQITYTATNIPGAAYAWTLPTGWAGSSTTNTITATPNGTGAGRVSATATFSCNGTAFTPSGFVDVAYQASNPPNVSNTSLSGPAVVCSQASYTLQNPPAGFSPAWASSNPSGLSVDNNGNVTRLNNFIGIVNLTASFINGNCGTSTTTRSIEVGAQMNGTFTFGCSGCPTVPSRPLQTVNFISVPSSYIGGPLSVTPCISQPGASNWQWTLQSGNAGFFGSNSGCLGFSINRGQSATFVVSADVVGCGRVSRTLTFSVSSGFGSFAVFPNPVNEELNVVATSGEAPSETEVTDGANLAVDESFEADVRLLDASNQTLRQGKMRKGRLKLKTSGVRDGLYYLQIQNKEGSETRQVLIRH